MMDPSTGRLWLTYGTYYGFIRLIELDPNTGGLKAGSEPVDVATACEASTMVYRDGWYYLFATHGSCCDGANSTYNVVVGRSKMVTGPFMDNVGRSMMEGGGKMVVATRGGLIGPGHFGRIVMEKGVEKMSIHYEADLNQGGRSVLGILPVVWRDGWPVAGEKFKEGTYERESVRRGYGLELAVNFARMEGGGMGGFGQAGNAPATTVAFQKLEDVIGSWPKGDVKLRIGDYMSRPHQNWTITDAPDTTGYLGGPYYKIVIAGTNRALAATADAKVITVPEFTGAPEQLWRIDQLTDGTYRIMPKVVPNSGKKLVLASSGDSTPTLAEFDFESDNYKWNFRSH